VRSSLFLSCVLASFVVACSSTSSSGIDGGTSDSSSSGDTNTGGGDTATSGDTHTGGDTSTTTDTGSGGDTGPTDPTCAAAATNADCQKCCRDAHTDGYTAFADALVTCACKSGNCDTACGATVCAATPKNPDDTCNACLANVQKTGGACVDDIKAVCDDPSKPCYAFEQCIATSACNSKG
jgi:hypothetical protein